MKRVIAGGALALLGLGLVALALIGTLVHTYNRLVPMDESVKTAFSQVQVQYQRRADLIPNLVEVVRGYARHEKEVLVGVAEARAKVGRLNLNLEGGGLSPQAPQQFMEAQGALTEALSRQTEALLDVAAVESTLFSLAACYGAL